MVKKPEDKKKKIEEAKKRKNKERQRWEKVKKQDEKLGEAKAILPSPYEGERLIMRERKGEEAIEINMVRENTEGEKERVGKTVVKKKGERKGGKEESYEVRSVEVKEPYRRSNIATSMESIARKAVKEDAGKKKPLYEFELTEKGKKFMENRGMDEENVKQAVENKLINPEKLEEQEIYIKQGKEEKAIEPKEAAEQIMKGKEIETMIEKGEIQKSNYQEVMEKLKDKGENMKAYRVKGKIEKKDSGELNL